MPENDMQPSVAAQWDAQVASYDAVVHPFTSCFARDVVARLGDLTDKRLLDVATGTGALALVAADAGANVLEIDFAPGMVARVDARRHPRIRARCLDGQALDLPTGGFDCVASLFGVVLFPDWCAGLAEMARVCRRNGTVAVTTWKDPQGAAIFLLLAQIRRQLFPSETLPTPAAPGLTTLADVDALCAALCAAGFETPQVTETSHAFRLQAEQVDRFEHELSQAVLWTTLDSPRQALVIAEIRRRLAQSPCSGTLAIESPALIAIARRN